MVQIVGRCTEEWRNRCVRYFRDVRNGILIMLTQILRGDTEYCIHIHALIHGPFGIIIIIIIIIIIVIANQTVIPSFGVQSSGYAGC